MRNSSCPLVVKSGITGPLFRSIHNYRAIFTKSLPISKYYKWGNRGRVTDHEATCVEATHVPQHQHGGGAVVLRRRWWRGDEGQGVLQRETLSQHTEEEIKKNQTNIFREVLPPSSTDEEETEGRKENCDWLASLLYSGHWVCL